MKSSLGDIPLNTHPPLAQKNNGGGFICAHFCISVGDTGGLKGNVGVGENKASF